MSGQAEARLRASLDRAAGDGNDPDGFVEIGGGGLASGHLVVLGDGQRVRISVELDLGTADLICQILALRERGVGAEDIVLGHCLPMAADVGGFRKLGDILEEVLVEIKPADGGE